MDSIFSVEDLKFSYSFGTVNIEALQGVSMNLQKGKFYCLSGPSGSGKTTFLNLLGLIEDVQGGDIEFQGKKFKSITEQEKNYIRRNQIGFIFQHFNLFPVLSAEENIEFFLVRQGVKKAERKKLVDKALKDVGLWDHRGKRPLEMSGGQRQRVAVARALTKRPLVIIGDEPTASLDQKTGKEIVNLLKNLSDEYGASIILSSHDTMVHEFAEELVILKDGRLAS